MGVFPPPTEPIPNYTFIQLEMDAESTAALDIAKKSMLQEAEAKSGHFFNWNAFVQMHRMNKQFHRHPVVEQLKRDDHFDLIVFGWFLNDFNIGLAAHFKCPSVIISGMPAIKFLRDHVGNPSSVSYAPFHMYSINQYTQMTFKQRIYNHLFVGIEFAITSLVNYFVFEPTYAELYPASQYPSMAEARKNVSLVMVSSHFSQSSPMATFPALLEISGIQIEKNPNPLPLEIQSFLDGATEGAIFFSFGSNVKSADMSDEKRRVILKVFGALKQRVLWKWEDDNLPGKPSNVMIGKWLPQNDVLAHPNVRLFISHCGKGSVNEARYHGVPILAMPVFGDQMANAAEIVDEGWAVQLHFGDLTEESFGKVLNEVLGNPKYRQLVKKSSDLYKDRPQHPLDTAVYWTEYVLRHGGAKHMQSQAVHLNWFQQNSLDVLAALIVVAWISWRLAVWTGKVLFGKCVGRGTDSLRKKRN